VWGAINPETGVSYLYHEYYRSQAEPVIHAAGIKAVGDWIPGVEDPSCLGSTPVDGRSTMEMLTDLGLDVQPAVNAVRDLRSRLLLHFGQIVAACCGLGFSWEGFSRETRVASMPQPARMAKLLEGPQW